MAFNKLGLFWTTKRLAFDGFKISEIKNNNLKGEYFDIRSDSIETFEVDLSNGDHKNKLGDIT